MGATQSTDTSSQFTQKKKKGEVISQPTAHSSQDENKVMPKKPSSAYIFFATATVKKIVEEQKISYPQAMKKAGEVWNSLDDDGKKPFVAMSSNDQIRYEKEMKQMDDTGYFTNKDGVCSSTLKAKPKKVKRNGMIEVVQKVAPKKACVPYIFYMKEHASEVMKQHGLKSCSQAASIVSKTWKEMSEAQK